MKTNLGQYDLKYRLLFLVGGGRVWTCNTALALTTESLGYLLGCPTSTFVNIGETVVTI